MKMEAGLGVLHLFGQVSKKTDREAIGEAIRAADDADCQVITAAILGHKADVCFMALCADWSTLRAFQTAVTRAGIGVVDSYVSITEVSEYTKGMPEEMLQARLHPQIPPDGLDAFCFYPMSKKREAHANWFATPFDERLAMMMEHGSSGRTFAGRVAQLVTGSTGLDDHEWGVTLFAATPDVIKDVVYTLRFDEGSALYGDFGAFYVGYLSDLVDIV